MAALAAGGGRRAASFILEGFPATVLN